MNNIYNLLDIPFDHECMPYPDHWIYNLLINVLELTDMIGLTITWSCM